jgi:hypothetical protein
MCDPNAQTPTMNWENYEEIVKSIYERLGAQNGVRVVCYGRDCKVTGKSGVVHQVDVLLEHSDGLHTYRTAVECKYWDRRRPKDDATKLAEILEDAQIHKGVIVSKLGFTEDAMLFARYKNIELVELRQPTQEDWKGRIKDIHFDLTIHIPIATDFRISTIDDNSQSPPMQSQTVDSSKLIISEPGQPPKTLVTIMNGMIAAADSASNEPKLVRHVFSSGTTAKDLFGRPEAKVAAVEFMLKFETRKQSSVSKGEDHVAMIMRSLFDKRRFVISHDGDIRESEA